MRILQKAQQQARQIKIYQDIRRQKKKVKPVLYSPLSLVEFIQKFWYIVEPSQQYQHNWHIEAIAEHLEAISRGEITQLVINIPPGHMKSSLICVFWPMWEWGEINPSIRSIFSSYAQDLAIRDSRKARLIVSSQEYLTRYPHVRLTPDQKEKKKFENTRTGFRQSTSVGGQGTGARADRIVVDDPHKVSEADSDLKREAVLTWWSEEMSTRGSDPEKSAHIIIMQRVHHEDLSAWAIANNYEHLYLPAEFEPHRICKTSLGYPDKRTSAGELLWPEKFTHKALDRIKKNLGTYGFSAQFQQNPTPKEGGILKHSWWRFYTKDDLPIKFKRLIWSWDTAYKAGEENDYSVGLLIGETKNGYYILELLRNKLEYPHLRRLIESAYQQYKSNYVLIEDKASGISLIQDLKRNTKLPIKAIKVDRDKVSRVHAISPIVECGLVFLPDQTEWTADFILEASQFPKGGHDDQIDALTQGLIYLNHSSSGMWGNL